MTELSNVRAPTDKPPFTVSQIKKVVPPHCFTRSLVRSFAYLFFDIFRVVVLLLIADKLIPSLSSKLQLAAWPIYWVLQGCNFAGIWSIGHDCGHHAFSDYILVNDIVGLFIHSALLTPYYSWKITHRHHHNHTGSVEHEEVYTPKLKSELEWFRKIKLVYENPIVSLCFLTFLLLFTFPMYLLFNFGGKPYPRWASHFNPYSPQYSKSEHARIIISDVGVCLALYSTYWLAAAYGDFWWILRLYYAPLLVLNACIFWISYLNHTHLGLPHYDSKEWDYLRGALSTVDRDFGIINHVFHHATDGHVAHHLFTTIPHYNLMEATKAIRPLLGEYYFYDRTSAFSAIWRVGKECIYVVPDEQGKKGVYWHHNKL